jgi:hypothetical protein
MILGYCHKSLELHNISYVNGIKGKGKFVPVL